MIASKKIAILTPTFSRFSGIDRLVEREAEEYAKRKDQVTIYTFEGDIKTPFAKVIIMGMPKSPFLQRLYRLLFFLDFPKLNRCTKSLKDYDMVISHFYPLNLLASRAKKKYRIKYIYHNAGIASPKLFATYFERAYMWLFARLTNYSIRNADEIISISGYLKDELKKETGLDSRVEYCRIDTKRFHKGISPKSIIGKFKLCDSPVLLYVGRISPHKGLHLLLQAFEIINKRIPKAKLIIVGKHTFDSYSKLLEKQAGKNVIFAGYVPDEELPYYYAACSIYVTASLWEGFDLPAVEAQAMGKMVVAFDVCSHKEVIKNGALVKENDIVGFAKAAIDLIKEHEKKKQG